MNPGTYYVGVSSAGNNAYNPAIPDSGGGGNTQGDYELEIQFTPLQSSGLTDVGGQLFDGDTNQQPGGIFNFWFNTQTATNTIYVDTLPSAAATGALGSITNPYTTIPAALTAAALNTAVPGDIVRIEGNDPDGNWADTSDEEAYEIGYNLSGGVLPDGASMQVPKGVTVMIDAGAIFKLRQANITAGSVSENINQSGGALQVLGIPQRQVYFTSFNNTSLGTRTATAMPGPRPVQGIGAAWSSIVMPTTKRTGSFWIMSTKRRSLMAAARSWSTRSPRSSIPST